MVIAKLKITKFKNTKLKITGLTQKIESWATKSKLIYFMASQYYREVIKREICLAGITSQDHVLFIGGGNCPFSAILLHQYTGAKVTVIDHNITCVQNAQEAICRLGLEDHVSVLCREGADLKESDPKISDLERHDLPQSDHGQHISPLSDYTVIHFALQVTPLEYVFSQVKNQMKPGTRVLVRKPKTCLKMVYSICPQLKACPYITHKARNIGSTLLFR